MDIITIAQSVDFITGPSAMSAYTLIEDAARVCYKSEGKATATSYEPIIKMLIKLGHHSVLEHVSVTLKFITNRGVTHELVRHRIAAYSQESTRYVNYLDRGAVFIRPVWWDCWSNTQKDLWEAAITGSTFTYKKLLETGATPQEARDVLPNALKTEIFMTANIREWRHVIKLRTSKRAHPQMRELIRDAALILKDRYPLLFEDLDIT